MFRTISFVAAAIVSITSSFSYADLCSNTYGEGYYVGSQIENIQAGPSSASSADVTQACFNAITPAFQQLKDSSAPQACEALGYPSTDKAIVTHPGALVPGVGSGSPSNVACYCFENGNEWMCYVGISGAKATCCYLD